MTVEELLRKDAQEAIPAETTHIAVELLRPDIARAAMYSRRRRRQQCEWRIFLLAAILFSVLLLLSVQALLQGRYEQFLPLVIYIVTLATGALLLLPLLEKFHPYQK